MEELLCALLDYFSLDLLVLKNVGYGLEGGYKKRWAGNSCFRNSVVIPHDRRFSYFLQEMSDNVEKDRIQYVNLVQVSFM